MVIFPYKHSYATQKLWESNIHIYIGKKQILVYPFDKKHWEYPKLQTKIICGQTLHSSEQKFKVIDTYEDLLSLGFQITVARASGKFFRGQKVQYLLIRKRINMFDLGRIPKDHRVEYDIINKRIRLLGKNSNGRWIYFESKLIKSEYDVEFNPFSYNNPIRKYEDYLKKFSPFPNEEEPKELIIDEIPVMLSEDKKLICKPRSRDTSVMGWYGMRRSGKSMGIHGFLERAHHKWGVKPFMVNDIQRETGTYCLAWNNPTFIKQLESIGETTQPLPMVYLHPFTYDFKELINQEVSFPISIPFKESMREYEWFLKGKKEWEFEKSGTYFRNLIFNDDGSLNKNGLLGCKSYEDIKDLILKQEEKEVQEEIRGQVITHKYIGFMIENEKVRYKLMNVLKDVCNTQIFDITNGIQSKWIVELPDGKHQYYPWTACLITNLFPSLITSDLRTKHFFPQYFRFVIDDIFQFQKEDPISRKNNWEIALGIDELQGITDMETKETLNKIVRESGLARIGVYYTSLNVDKVPDDMKLLTDTVFVFRQKKQQANLISKDFDLLNYKEKEMMGLKPFECIAIGNFVAYDTDGNREIISDEPIRGTILPSVSMHQAPKLLVEDES